MNIPLSQKKIIDDKKCYKNRMKKYSNVRQGCFNSKYLKRKLGLRKFDLVMLLDFKPHFLSPKVSELKNISAHQQEAGVMAVLNIAAFILGHTVVLGLS